MEKEKKYFGGWWVWVLFLSIITLAILFAFSSGALFLGKKVERAVLVNSHQYIEGMEQRGAIMQANLAEAQARLAAESDPEVKANIQSQISVLKAQLSAIRIIQQ